MITTSRDKTRSHVTVIDGSTRRGAKCVTVYGLKPEQVIRLILRAVRGLKKAG